MVPVVTVVVVSWNTRELLARCLESLAPEVEAGRARVRVVDNASADGSAGLVRDRFGWAELLEPGENLGFGRAANLGLRGAATPWVAVSNADTAPEPGALAEMVETGMREPRAGAVAPRLILPDGSTQQSVLPLPTLRFILAFNLGLGRRAPQVPWALGAFLVLPRPVWERLGGFDESHWMYAEDLDLGWRLHEAGLRTVHAPDARVLHESSAAADQAFGNRVAVRQHEATYEWLRRRCGPGRARAIATVNVLGALVRGQRHWARLHAVGLLRGRSSARKSP